MEKRVDAIFAGGGLTALAAAAILARRGKGVLVLDGEERLKTGPGGSPFEFASGPFLLLGFEERGAMEGFFSELRLPIPSLKKQGFFFKRISPVLQFVLPGRRLNLYAQQEEYIEELKREFGDQLPAIKSLLQEVGKYDAVLYPYLGRFAQMEIRGLGDRFDAWKRKLRFLSTVRTLRGKSADAFLAPFGFSPKFLGYLNLQSLFAFKKALAGISSFEFVLLVSALQKGGVRMVGGYPTLVRFFLKLIREQGGEVLQERKIAKIEMEGGKATAAILDDKTRVSCRRLIITRAAPDPFLNFYFTLPKESVPGPMKENVLMTWGEAAPPEVEDLMILKLTLPEEEGGWAPGLRGLAVTLFPRPGADPTGPQKAALKKKVLERLDWLIPFSKSEIREAESGPGSSPPPAPFPSELESDWRKTAKEMRKETLRYERPSGAKNVLLIKNDLSEQLMWGSDFLAAEVLARLIEEGR